MDEYGGLGIWYQTCLPVDFLPFGFGPSGIGTFVGRGRGRLVYRTLINSVVGIGRPCYKITLAAILTRVDDIDLR